MRHHPYKTYGVLLVLVAVGLVTLSILQFNRVFTPADYVTVHVDRAGLQLLQGSDVKMRGVIVGSVATISSTGQGADLRLRMDPQWTSHIPSNVTVRLLPKTLFGEKYVDLVPPASPSTQHLADGAVIREDQTRPTLEIDQALDDLLPMLRTVPPVELNHTLTALATALDGRGAELGQTIDELDTYLEQFNPHLPQLAHDMQSLSAVTHTYAAAAPALMRMLDNLTVTSHTVVDQQQQIQSFLTDVTGAANATHDLLARNATDIVAVNRVTRPVLSLLARYSPEFPCFFKGYAGLVPRIHSAVMQKPGLNHAAHVIVEFVPTFPTYQRPIDLPEFKDTRGPSCYGLPHPPMSLPVIRYKDGTEDDPRFDGQGKVGGQSKPASPASQPAMKPMSFSRSLSPAMGIAGTGEERRAFDALLGPILGISSMSVPDIADLLWGPLARGQTVRLS